MFTKEQLHRISEDNIIFNDLFNIKNMQGHKIMYDSVSQYNLGNLLLYFCYDVESDKRVHNTEPIRFINQNLDKKDRFKKNDFKQGLHFYKDFKYKKETEKLSKFHSPLYWYKHCLDYIYHNMDSKDYIYISKLLHGDETDYKQYLYQTRYLKNLINKGVLITHKHSDYYHYR